MFKTRLISYLLLGAVATTVPACGDDDNGEPPASDDDDDDDAEDAGMGSKPDPTDEDAGMGPKPDPTDDDAGTNPDPTDEDAGMDPDPVDCPDVDDREIEEVEGEIDEDTVWSCDTLYILTEKIYVVGGATLTIEAGVEVQGDKTGALISTISGRLVTEGTAHAPVVFTSSKAPGKRKGGDWAGVVMLGEAPINVPGGTNLIEGLDASEDRGEYGGTDEAHDCGHIKYTRIEWAGEEISLDNELNTLTLGGCGSDTTIEYVQVHKGLDDGVEIFGGSPNVHHIVASSISDDSLDWDQGFSGNVQFYVAIQDSADGDVAWETDNNEADNDAMPRSNPTVYNVTLIGGANVGWVARRGTWGTVANAIFMDFPLGAIDVRDAASVAGTDGANPELTVTNSLFFNNGADGETHFPDETGQADNDAAFDEAAYFTDSAWENQFDADPELPDTDRTAPDLVPPASSPAATGGATPPNGFDKTATYIGAFEPGGEDWTAGWTAFPED